MTQRLLRHQSTVTPLYLRCGLRWERIELYWLRRWLGALRHARLRPLTVLTVPFRDVYGTHWSLGAGPVPSVRSRDQAVYLPGRNILLIGCAAVFAARRRLSRLALGTLAGNPFGDATPAFFQQFGRCLSRALAQPMRILAPLRACTKAQLVAAHRDAPLHLTFSCLRPAGRRHCGRCNKCAERRRAFRLARVPDRTAYAAGGA